MPNLPPALSRPRLAAWACAAFAVGCQPHDGAATAEAPPGDAGRGQRLVAQYQCSACHAIPGVPGAQRPSGPSLLTYGGRAYLAGRLPLKPETLARWIAEPAALLPDTTMPDMGASDADARDMAAYLLSLR